MEKYIAEWLLANEITHKCFSHPPVMTVAEAKEHCAFIPGQHCKNLFLKDSKAKKFFLVTLPSSKQTQMRELRKLIKAKKLSFGSDAELMEHLGLKPGAVSPFGLINDRANLIHYVVDKEVWEASEVCFHPNTNDETLLLTQEAFHRAVKSVGNYYTVLEL